MPRHSGAEYREVGAWIVAGAVLLACWVGFAGARRRAERREAESKARARARRPRMPLVSANVRGQPMRRPDIWREETEGASQGRTHDA
jgi:hypothetical protein